MDHSFGVAESTWIGQPHGQRFGVGNTLSQAAGWRSKGYGDGTDPRARSHSRRIAARDGIQEATPEPYFPA